MEEKGKRNMEKSTLETTHPKLLDRGRKWFIERVVDVRKGHGKGKASKTIETKAKTQKEGSCSRRSRKANLQLW